MTGLSKSLLKLTRSAMCRGIAMNAGVVRTHRAPCSHLRVDLTGGFNRVGLRSFYHNFGGGFWLGSFKLGQQSTGNLFVMRRMLAIWLAGHNRVAIIRCCPNGHF